MLGVRFAKLKSRKPKVGNLLKEKVKLRISWAGLMLVTYSRRMNGPAPIALSAFFFCLSRHSFFRSQTSSFSFCSFFFLLFYSLRAKSARAREVRASLTESLQRQLFPNLPVPEVEINDLRV
jgi:hypothetical protein